MNRQNFSIQLPTIHYYYYYFYYYYIIVISLIYSGVIVQAHERREGVNKDYDEHAELQSTTADYRAVAPDAKMSVAFLSYTLASVVKSSVQKCLKK